MPDLNYIIYFHILPLSHLHLRTRRYDRHFNLLLEDVKEMWTETSKGGKSAKNRGTAVNKDRYVSKMFLRGDSVVLIVSNPAGLAAQQ